MLNLHIITSIMSTVRKSPRAKKLVSLFSQEPEPEQHLKSPTKRQSSPSKQSPKKGSPKNAGKKKVEGKHKYHKMVVGALTALGRNSGTRCTIFLLTNSAHSLPAIIKYIQSNYQLDTDEAAVRRYVKLTLHRGPFTKIRASYRLKGQKATASK